MNELKTIDLNIDQYGLQENKSDSIKKLYIPMINGLDKLETEFNETIIKDVTKKTIKDFKALRLKIAKLRTSANNARKEAKEEYLQVNKAIQGAYNTLEYATKSKESKLLEKEKYFENLEIERIENLQVDRSNKLEEYNVYPIPLNLGIMEDDVWNVFLTGAKATHKAIIEAEKLAEQQRIEKERIEAEEKERLRLEQIETQKENERLKKEAEEKQKLIDEENYKREKESEKVRLEQQAILQKELDEKEKLHNKILEQEQKENERLKKLELIKQNELNKGDKEKVDDLKSDLESLKGKYSFKSQENIKMYNDVNLLIEKIILHINQ
jgi:hypothetical protein